MYQWIAREGSINSKEAAMAQTVILGEKVGMTQKWVDDRVVPVTVLRVDPMRIVQIKTTERDGYTALQVTYGHRDAKKLNKPAAGHYDKAGVQPGKRLVELRLDSVDGYEIGQEITVEALAAGSSCRCHRNQPWQGLRRCHEASQLQGPWAPATATTRPTARPARSAPVRFPGRVFKGQKMAGHMGHEQVTTLNLEVVDADTERNLLLIKGSVPGPNGGVVSVRNAVKAAVKGA